jgi:hypothetical protein
MPLVRTREIAGVSRQRGRRDSSRELVVSFLTIACVASLRKLSIEQNVMGGDLKCVHLSLLRSRSRVSIR